MIIHCYSLDEFTQVIARLVKEGIMFEAHTIANPTYTIELTGGY